MGVQCMVLALRRGRSSSEPTTYQGFTSAAAGQDVVVLQYLCIQEYVHFLCILEFWAVRQYEMTCPMCICMMLL